MVLFLKTIFMWSNHLHPCPIRLTVDYILDDLQFEICLSKSNKLYEGYFTGWVVQHFLKIRSDCWRFIFCWSFSFYSILVFVCLLAGNLLPALLLATVQLGAMSGLITAAVIKKLDNIVKIYSQSLTGKFPFWFSVAKYFLEFLLSLESRRCCHLWIDGSGTFFITVSSWSKLSFRKVAQLGQ